MALTKVNYSMLGPDGLVLQGLDAALTNGDMQWCSMQLAGDPDFNPDGGCIALEQHSNDQSCAFLGFFKSRNTNPGQQTAVQLNDDFGELNYHASDGTNYKKAALITAVVDGPVSPGIVPARLTFWTMHDDGTLIEGFKIDSKSHVVFGGNTATSDRSIVRIGAYATGKSSFNGILNDQTIKQDVTGTYNGHFSYLNTEATTFTISNVQHFVAGFNSQGAGSVITSQFGFKAEDTLVNAATNYGFFSANAKLVGAGKTHFAYYTSSDIATGGGTTWAFYGAGTAPSFFGGAVRCDSTAYFNGDVTQKLAASVTPTANSELMMQLTSNTQLTIKVRGTDGVVRSANITLA